MTAAALTVAPLADRIASALRRETPSDAIAALIAEAERASEAASGDRAAARGRALDPTAGVDAASAAKRKADDLGFELDRLTAALEALREAREVAAAREADAGRRAAYETALAERDSLSDELREVYPELERCLADLVGRVAANDSTLEQVNRQLPSGGEWLAGAEEVARGGVERFGGRREFMELRITSQLRLPRFECTPRAPYAWPRLCQA